MFVCVFGVLLILVSVLKSKRCDCNMLCVLGVLLVFVAMLKKWLVVFSCCHAKKKKDYLLLFCGYDGRRSRRQGCRTLRTATASAWGHTPCRSVTTQAIFPLSTQCLTEGASRPDDRCHLSCVSQRQPVDLMIDAIRLVSRKGCRYPIYPVSQRWPVGLFFSFLYVM